ncbi:MAG: hypothetical protein ACTSP9_10655 [Promethearchaeota archaeon]
MVQFKERYYKDGNLIDLTYEDIIDVYGEHTWVYENWGDSSRYGEWNLDPDFNKELEDFNLERNDFRTMLYPEFVKKYGRIIYDKYYDNVLTKTKNRVKIYYIINQVHNIGTSNWFEDVNKIEWDNIYSAILRLYGYKVYF